MREIKFRAWDKRTNSWFKTELEFNGFALFGECTLICPPKVTDLKHLEVTQYIGSKDKNKKEIYADDIMESKDGLRRYVVTYIERQAKWYLKGIGKAWAGNDPIWDEYEIIGNKFENPELLKVEV